MTEDKKLDELAERIREVQAKAEKMPSVGSGAPMEGSRIGIEFATAVLGSAFLGWLVDMAVPQYAPWPMMGMILLGFLSGLLNMWRALSGTDKAAK